MNILNNLTIEYFYSKIKSKEQAHIEYGKILSEFGLITAYNYPFIYFHRLIFLTARLEAAMWAMRAFS